MAKPDQKTEFPRTPLQLRAWLRDTETGRYLARQAARNILEEACRKCQKIRPYPRVLVVVRRLGPKPGVEVYSEKGVTIMTHELVDTHDDPASEVLAEELLALQVPKSWRFLLGMKPESRVFTGLEAEATIRAIQTMRTIRELRG